MNNGAFLEARGWRRLERRNAVWSKGTALLCGLATLAGCAVMAVICYATQLP